MSNDGRAHLSIGPASRYRHTPSATMRSILSFANANSGRCWLGGCAIKLACSGGGAYLCCDTLAALRATDSREQSPSARQTFALYYLVHSLLDPRRPRAGKYGNALAMLLYLFCAARRTNAALGGVLVIELGARGETDLLLCGGAAKVLLLLRFIAAAIYG